MRHLPAGAREEQEGNPAIGRTDAGRTPQALPVHPWSRRYGLRPCRSDSAQILCRGLAALSIGDDFEFDLLSFVQPMHPGAFNRADMHEHVLAAIVRLNEAESFLAVEPLHGSSCHKTLSFSACVYKPRPQTQPFRFEILEEVVSLHAISGGPSRPAETRWASNRASSFDLQDTPAHRLFGEPGARWPVAVGWSTTVATFERRLIRNVPAMRGNQRLALLAAGGGAALKKLMKSRLNVWKLQLDVERGQIPLPTQKPREIFWR
jgi:hypothetical protein